MPRPDFPALLERVEHDDATDADVSALEQWVDGAPEHVTGRLALARVCEGRQRWEQARRHWRYAALLQPSSPAVRAGLQRTDRRLSDDEEAAAALTLPADVLAPDGPPPEAEFEAASEKKPETASATDLETGATTNTPRSEVPSEDAPFEDAPSEQASSADALSPRAAERTVLHELEEDMPDGAEDRALDGLIEDLQSARIDPAPDPDDVPAPDLDAEDDDDDMVSPTLARIYEAQGQHAEAARVYRRLAEQHPARAEEYRRRAEAIDAQTDEQ
jgi:tetratricopeptide (TPR) repeat protein